MNEVTRFLIVDDDDLVREALQLKVEDLLSSYVKTVEVHIAGDGQQALQLLQQQKYHFILMDTQMPPGLPGYEVCSQMKKEHPDLTIFGMSMDHTCRQQWLDAGADGFVPKSQLNRSLENVVSDYLGKNKRF